MSLFNFPNRVNERAARLVAATVVVLLATAYLADLRWLVAVVAAGFVARVASGPRYSALGRAAVWAAPKLWPSVPVAGAPKRFAQGIGAVCTLSSAAFLFLGYTAAGWGLAGAVVLFATLEAGAGFCVGCYAYGKLQRWGAVRADACVDCATAGASRPLE